MTSEQCLVHAFLLIYLYVLMKPIKLNPILVEIEIPIIDITQMESRCFT
jgi:hypothetical protein